MKKYPELQTDRLLLRGFQLDDAPQVQVLAGSYEVAEMTLNIPHPYLDGMAETWIKGHQEQFDAGEAVVFAILESGAGNLVGAAGLILTQRFNRGELGYWVGKPFWGKGIATEAAFAVLKYGFEEMRLNKIYATHMIKNPASGRVMQKIGMEQEGILKEHALKWDQFVDLVAYGILSSSWRKQHPQ